MGYYHRRTAIGFLSLALVLTLFIPVLGQRLVTVPVGTVIPLRMDTYLSSDSSSPGSRFTTTVSRSVVIDGRIVVPQNAKVEGHVTGATPAERGRKAGTITIAFDRIAYPNGNLVPVAGTLTTLSEEGRRRIEQDMSNEDSVEGGSRTRRAVIFIGVGGEAGVGAILGTTGVFLGTGEKAEVHPGTVFGMMVELSFTVDTNTINVADQPYFSNTQTGLPSQTLFTSAESVRFAQITLRDRGHYNGPITGEMTDATRNAIRQFQYGDNLVITGSLDLRTARVLGIAGESGAETRPIEVVKARAERVDRDSIRVSLDAHMQGSGWQVFVNRFVTANTLHLYVRGVPPRVLTGTGTDNHAYTATYDNLPNITRVIIHGPQRDFTFDLPYSVATGNGSGSRDGI